MALDEFLKVQEQNQTAKEDSLVSTARPGTVDVVAEETGKFPFDAFGFDIADENEWPQIWVKYPWTILGPTICLRPRDEGDDEEYIEQALDYLKTRGGTLLFADGTFLVNKSSSLDLEVTSGKVVTIKGNGASYLQGSFQIQTGGAGDVVIRELGFVGNSESDDDFAPDSSWFFLDFKNTGSRSGVFDCTFKDSVEAKGAIYIDGCDYVRFERNLVLDVSYGNRQTSMFSAIQISGDTEYAFIRDNVCRDNGNLIDRGDCQSTTPPMIAGETTPSESNVTWERVSCATEGITGYGGAEYCYKFTISSSGVGTYVYMCDVYYTSANMHGIVPGLTYKWIAQIYTPLTGGVTPGDIKVQHADYDGSNTTTSVNSPTTADEWNEVEISHEVQDDATGYGCNVHVTSGDAVATEYFYVSHVRLVPVGLHNEHSQQFSDSGTGTQVSSNSWNAGFVG